jgi:pimeloyl-ACP methyl ester carboxylesterase
MHMTTNAPARPPLVAGWARAAIQWGFRCLQRIPPPSPQVLPPLRTSATPLVVLLHGFAGAPREMLPLGMALSEAYGAALDVVNIACLDPDMGVTPDDTAARLVQFLAAQHLLTRPLCVIGHSMGGLVARRLAHWPGIPDLRGVVLIATPNAGLHWWNALPIHWTRSVGFHERFNRLFPARAPVRYQLLVGTHGGNFVEGSPNDGVVGAWSASHLASCPAEPAALAVHAYPLDHWELLIAPRPTADIVAFVGTTLLEPGR